MAAHGEMRRLSRRGHYDDGWNGSVGKWPSILIEISTDKGTGHSQNAIIRPGEADAGTEYSSTLEKAK